MVSTNHISPSVNAQRFKSDDSLLVGSRHVLTMVLILWLRLRADALSVLSSDPSGSALTIFLLHDCNLARTAYGYLFALAAPSRLLLVEASDNERITLRSYTERRLTQLGLGTVSEAWRDNTMLLFCTFCYHYGPVLYVILFCVLFITKWRQLLVIEFVPI